MTIPDNEFVQRFREAVAAHSGRRPSSPAEILDIWEEFVRFCEQGYTWSIYEYDNDISVRDLIEKLLGDQRFESVSQMNWFREQANEIDHQFKALLRPEPVGRPGKPWWRARIPSHAGQELAADIESRYGVLVEVRE